MKIIEAKEAFVYAVLGGGFCKVGYTGNVHRRFASLQDATPLELTPAFFAMTTAKAAPKAEYAAHALLAEYHHRGEWFAAPLDVIRAAILSAIEATEAKLYPDINWFPNGRLIYDSPTLM